MGPIGHQRIAQRYTVATTPIRWKIPKRKGLHARSRAVPAEAAIVELSIMGAAVVCPLKWRAVVGSKVEIEWEGQKGLAVVRREAVYPRSTTVALYGIEWAESSTALAGALFDRLVMEPSAKATASGASDAPPPQAWAPAPDPEAMTTPPSATPSGSGSSPSGPAQWAAPNTWSPDAR
jgi:hypothetical protein